MNMNDSTENSSQNSSTKSDQANKPQKDEHLVDPRDLVYAGGTDRNPRELVENPGVAPEMLEDQSPEDLRDDLMPRDKEDDE